MDVAAGVNDDVASRPPLTVAYGGGGLFGIGYLMGVAESLIEYGIPLGAAPSLGTSAGSWAAASVDLGITWDDALIAFGEKVPRLPDPRSGRLRDVAARIYGERRAPHIRVSVTELPLFRRVLLQGADHPIADLVAASSAVPGMLAPHKIGKKRYLDGGVRSLVSADQALPADHLLVIAPLAGPMFGPAGGVMERTLRKEMDLWHRNNRDGQHWLIRPNRAIARLARRPDQLFDGDLADECYDLAREQGWSLAERFVQEYPGLLPS